MSTYILWLDRNVDSTTSFLEKLSQYQWVQTFTEVDDCVEYIKSHMMQNLFVVASGSLAKFLVPQIHQSSNIKQIFIFSASMASHTEWAMDYIDELLMFDHPDDLLERLWITMGQFFREQAQLYIEQEEKSMERAKQYKQPSCG
ncbi:unnamed protein product [Rotaria socialis]|uniref:Uncharacterized protein n=1 Tax=Rotaria socialis TaxID=392032 RepID=A0A820VGR7_9BILA|nr:unnamed protein product [Rotaria socialis]CAF3344184.1 unnamed protein product [Rotaria socialis]CAF3434065.1 unnamed protein product [Rotaria socialis]CAF4217181.1 unnamed protein product [Rotaria socialis]CAF4500624.1 unnamed protein product [Rotaria socialis]